MSFVEIQGKDKKIPVGDSHPVFIVAEIGKNFIQTEEDRPVKEYLENAISLVRAAKEAGADAVKFQTHNVEDEQANTDIVSPHFKGSDRYRWVGRNTLATPLTEFWQPLKRACDEIGIVFFSTPMSRGAAEKLSSVDPPMWKVGSGDILDFAMLDYMRRSGKPIIISTGMSTLEEIDAAVAFIREQTNQLVILHCVSRYPCPPEELRLNTIAFLQKRYGAPTGFSDHSVGHESAVAAAALGASVIEKHFSFDRALWGSDHKVSLCPNEFGELVRDVARVREDRVYREAILSSDVVRKGMGEETKILQEDEAVFRTVFRKTLVAARDIPSGTLLGPEHLFAMRPQAAIPGLPSEAYPHVIGCLTGRALHRYQPVTRDDFFKPSQ